MSESGVMPSFTPVRTGDVSKLAPDLPAGEWVASAKVKCMQTKNDGFPMLLIEWRVLEAAADENQSYVGAKVSDFVTFFPEEHRATKMARLRLKGLVEGLGLGEFPDTTSLAEGSWDSVQPFIAKLESGSHTIFTKVRVEKSGEQKAEVLYRRPLGVTL